MIHAHTHSRARTHAGATAAATASGGSIVAADLISGGVVSGGGVRVVSFASGTFDLASLISLTAPTTIVGAGAANTTLRGACGTGGVAAAAGTRVTIVNATLSGVALGASGAGTLLELRDVAVVWEAGCGCSGPPAARVGAAATMRVVSSSVCAAACVAHLIVV